MRILLVEDDPSLAPALVTALSPQYQVTLEVTWHGAFKRAASEQFSLYIVDISLPDGSGIDLIRVLKGDDTHRAVLMLTAECSTLNKVRALDAGADDYLTKPFSMRELEARLRALSRRIQLPPVITWKNLILDTSSKQVSANGVAVPMPQMEYNLLELLVRNKGIVVSHSRITAHVWKGEDTPSANTVAVHFFKLRRALAHVVSPHFIRTVPGRGYILDQEE